MKEVILKFKLDGVENSLKSVIDIQKAIEKIKASLSSGLSTEGFAASQAALAELEAEYEKLTSIIDSSNNAINASNSNMASATKTSTDDAVSSINNLGQAQDELENTVKNTNNVISNSASDTSKKVQQSTNEQTSHTQKKFKESGDNIEKFAKGIVDAVVGIGLVMGASKEDAEAFGKNFQTFVGISTAVKGAIEGASAGFDLLKNNFPSILSGLKSIWAVMVANPIGAVIAGITALSAGIAILISSFSDLSEEEKQARHTQEMLTDSYEEQEKQLQKINDELEKKQDLEYQSNQAYIEQTEALNKQHEISMELMGLDKQFSDVKRVNSALDKDLIDTYNLIIDTQEKYRKQILEVETATNKASVYNKKEIADIEKQIKSKETLIEISRKAQSDVIGGPTIAGTNYNAEENRLLKEKGELLERLKKEKEKESKLDTDLTVIRMNLNNVNNLNNVISKETVKNIQDEIKARGLQTELDKKAAEEKKKADEEAKKKREEDYRNYQDNIKKKYDLLIKTNELEIEKTREGSDARIFAEDQAYFAQLDFMEKNKKALELTQVDIDLFKQKHYNQDYEREKAHREMIEKLDKESYDKMVKNLEELTASKEKNDDNYISILKEKKANMLAEDKKNSTDILAINQQIYDAEYKQLDEKLAKEKAAIEKSYKERQAIIEQSFKDGVISQKEYDAQTKDNNDSKNQAILNADTKLEQDRIKLNHELAEDTKKTTEETEKEILDSLNQISSIVSSFSSSIMGIVSAIQESKRIDRENEFNELNASLEAQLAANQAYYDAAQAQLEESENAALMQEGLTEQEKINIKNNAEIAKVKLANEAAKADYDLKMQQYNAEETLKEKAFEQDKKFKTAQVVISTITGAIAAFTGMAQTIPGPYGLIAGALAAAAVVVMGAIQVSNIQKQKYNKGTPPTAPKPQVPNLTPPSSSGNAPTTSAPSIKDTTLYGTGGTGTGNGATKPTIATANVVVNNGEPLRAYVLTGDITSAQEAEEALRRKATGF